MNYSLLLVDDEFAFSELTKEYLEAKGFRVALCHKPQGVVDLLQQAHFDLCILDVKMPDKDGFTLAAEIKVYDESMPFIFLTGQTLKEDRIKGFKLGADDYIAKPFSMEELYFRILAIMTRYEKQLDTRSANNHYPIGKFSFNPEFRELSSDTNKLKLSAIESKLLYLLYQYKNDVLTRDTALVKIWGNNDIYKGRSMNVYITKLRQFLKEDPSIEILNLHGEGYKLSIR